MATIPSLKRLVAQDYPEMDEKLISSINSFLEPIINALSGNINSANSFYCIYPRYTLMKNTNVTAALPLKLAWTKSFTPSAVVIGGIWKRGADSSTSLNITVSVEWDYDSAGKQLIIKKINGLTLPSASDDYEITFLCYGI